MKINIDIVELVTMSGINQYSRNSEEEYKFNIGLRKKLPKLPDLDLNNGQKRRSEFTCCSPLQVPLLRSLFGELKIEDG